MEMVESHRRSRKFLKRTPSETQGLKDSDRRQAPLIVEQFTIYSAEIHSGWVTATRLVLNTRGVARIGRAHRPPSTHVEPSVGAPLWLACQGSTHSGALPCVKVGTAVFSRLALFLSQEWSQASRSTSRRL